VQVRHADHEKDRLAVAGDLDGLERASLQLTDEGRSFTSAEGRQRN
jgi:hypothetical protein